MEDELDTQLNRLRAHMLEEIIEQSAAAHWADVPEPDRPTCPDCGIRLHSQGKRKRTLQTHGRQEIHLERTYATCPHCGTGIFSPR